MADEIREYIRAAQEAELRGDGRQAAELLCKAGRLYRAGGKDSRALAMLRHALRLDPSRRELQEEIRRMEWVPEAPLQGALAGEDAEVGRALSALEDPSPRLVERGPTLADPDRNAWCSFCCRPSSEVGRLVAGPAGAFVCTACAREARHLLGDAGAPGATAPGATHGSAMSSTRGVALGSAQDPGSGSAPDSIQGSTLGSVQSPAPGSNQGAAATPGSLPREGRPSAAIDDAADRPEAVAGAAPGALADLPHQTAGIEQLTRAVEQGRRRILLLGPPGSGKSAMLRAIAQRGAGRVSHPARPEEWPSGGLVLLDAADALHDAEWARLTLALDRHPSTAILALRGRAPEATWFILTEDQREPLPSSQSLVTATGGKLPLGIAEGVDFTASLEAPDADALCLLGRHLLRGRVSDELEAGLAASLAELAAASGRGAHELVALARRVPPGAWRLDEPAGFKGRRRSRRKAGPK